jgi:hypothetical protein
MPSFLAIEGKVLMEAVKAGGRPSEAEMADLLQRSGLKGDFRYEIRGHSVEEIRDVYRAARNSSSLPDPETMRPESVIQHGIMFMVAAVVKEKGLTNLSFQLFPAAGDAALALYLFELTDNANDENIRFPAAAAPKSGWKFWAKPLAPHLENAETVMNGYALACGPQVIAKYKDRNPSPYNYCAFEIKRPKGAEKRSAELSFELSCPDCERTYALTNDLSGSSEGVREVHVKCPTCQSHRWILRTLSYWGKTGHEAWVLNVCADGKYLREANVALTRLEPRG